MPEKKDNQTQSVDTVRVAMFCNGKVLLLRKGPTSTNRGKYEYPGGKVEDGNKLESASREVLEETCKYVSENDLEMVSVYDISFETNGVTNYRNVSVFSTKLKEEGTVRINTTLDENGKPEDNHDFYVWVTRNELLAIYERGDLSNNTLILDEKYFMS